MHFGYLYTCNYCGDKRELITDDDDGGRCHVCDNGRYVKTGETYDQEWVDEQRYNEQQDREYEARHKYDRY